MNIMRYTFVSRPGRRVLVSSAFLLCFLVQLPKLEAQSVVPPATVASGAHKELFTKPAPMSSVAYTPASPANSATSAGRTAGLGAGGDFNSASPAEQQLHLIIGKSTFINTRHRLTRVYVTSPSILDTYTASPNQVVVTAKKPGVSSLILWDEAGESQAFNITSDLNVEVLRNSMREALPNQDVTVEGTEGRVVLTGTIPTQALADTAGKIALQYSPSVTNALVVNSSQVKQVRLQVRIVEVDRSKLNAFAFNFFNSGGNILGATTTGQSSSALSVTSGAGGGGGGSSVGNKSVTVSNPLNFLLYSSKLNIGATLQDLETLGLLQILSEPNITAMSGQKADFLAGGEFPFPVVQGGSGGLTSITIQFRQYGVKLEFTPLVNPDGTIELKVAPEVSSLDYTNSVQISGYTIPRSLHPQSRNRTGPAQRRNLRTRRSARPAHHRPVRKHTGHRQHSHPWPALQEQERQPHHPGAGGHRHPHHHRPAHRQYGTRRTKAAHQVPRRNHLRQENPRAEESITQTHPAPQIHGTQTTQGRPKLMTNESGIPTAAVITVCLDADTAERAVQAVERMPWVVTSSNYETYVSARPQTIHQPATQGRERRHCDRRLRRQARRSRGNHQVPAVSLPRQGHRHRARPEPRT